MTDKDVERNHVLAKRVLAVLMDRFEHGRSPEGNRVIWKAYELDVAEALGVSTEGL